MSNSKLEQQIRLVSNSVESGIDFKAWQVKYADRYQSGYSSAFHSSDCVSYEDRVRDIGTSVKHQLAVGTDSKMELVSIG